MPFVKKGRKAMGGSKGPEVRRGSSPTTGGMKGGSRRRRLEIGSVTVIDFVIDCSASMKNVLPTVYFFIKDLTSTVQRGGGEVRFGLTFFADNVEIKRWKGADFTDLPLDIMETMKLAEIGGGASGGREDIGLAVKASMHKLSQEPSGRRVMVLITDSAPVSRAAVNFKGKEALRAALLFVPAEYSGPEYLFDMVDARGVPDRSRTPYVFNIHEITDSRFLKIDEMMDDESVLRDNVVMQNQMVAALM